jgi:CHASE3 domain sensor protein
LEENMPTALAIDQTGFRRILTRNITLPLAVGVVSAAVFVALIFYLLSILNWVEHSERVIGNANEIGKLSVDMESGVRGYAITDNISFLGPYQLAKPRIAAEMATLANLVKDNPLQVDRLKRIEAMQSQWENFAQTAIRMRRNNEDYKTYIASGQGKLQFDEIRREFADFLTYEKRLRMERNSEARNVTIIVVASYLIISILLSGLLAFFGRRELLGLSTTYGNALQQHERHASALEQQAWQRNGQTQLAEQGIGQMALPLLGRTVLDFLAGYIGASVAALYVREENGSLRRVANYGFSKENEQSEQSFDHAESLVGQAALTKRLIHLNDVPDNYLKVTSGLGETKPRHVIVLPINHDGDVNGVIELGFLHPPAARDLEFLQLVAPNMGSAVEAALYRRRLQDALAETQQLNEELQVQQEELRTANEELEEQSRVLEESQVNLENQKAELEQTNEQLALQAVSLDQKNTALNDAQTALEERALDLQRASKYKSEFLANMSHELRTPLNSLLILAKLLADNQKGNLNEEQVKFANTIYFAGNDLLNLINDILDISKVEAGKLELTARTYFSTANGGWLAHDLRTTGWPKASEFHDRHRCQRASGNICRPSAS